MDKSPDAFRTISEVADELAVPQHVLRFWESRFPQIKPMKRGGGRRYYRPDDVDLVRGIRHLLYGEGYTIRGVQRILREQGGRFVQSVWRDGAPQPQPLAEDHAGEDDTSLDTEEMAEADVADAAPPPAVRKAPADAPAAAVAAPEPAVAVAAGLTVEDLQRLRTTLQTLTECRRRLDQALTEEA